MEKALITGANGFIGTALTDRLLREGVSVRAMCRSAERGNPLAQKGAEVVQGDVRDAELLKRYAVGCDVVFNLAAIGTGDWDTQHSINVEGARHVMDAAEGMGVQRFVHVSSIAVYGYEARGRVDENYPQRPPSNDYYMRTKSEGESLIWELAGKSNLEVVTVRPGYVYGPRSRTGSEAYYKRFQRHGYVMLAV